MKILAALLIAVSAYAADQPKPKQLSLEEGNILLQMRNQYTSALLDLARMESQIVAQEMALKSKYGIGQSCRIGNDGRSFIEVVSDNGKEITRPCPDAQPKPVIKEEKQ